MSLLTPDGGVWRDGVRHDHDRGGLEESDGRPGDVANLLNPLWTPDGDTPDPNKQQELVPEFADHPIPRVAQFMWVLVRRAGIIPPWAIRVHPAFAATYTIRRISQALSPHAYVVTDATGRLIPPEEPGYDMVFDFRDQHTRPGDAPIGSKIVTVRG